uniref:PRO2425 n=1 Tax=Homo sapiens TaxID=9606 RepID=Q9H3A2_HUMAN|nr:PRO2425 [Homo sapiens]
MVYPLGPLCPLLSRSHWGSWVSSLSDFEAPRLCVLSYLSLFEQIFFFFYLNWVWKLLQKLDWVQDQIRSDN